jgi:hypothetical protein
MNMNINIDPETENIKEEPPLDSINFTPRIILSRQNSRSKTPTNISQMLANMEEGKNNHILAPSDDSNYYNYDSEDENLLHIFDDVRINPQAKDIPH